jgi:hypothetical protein
MWIVDLIGGICEIWSSWRFYICVGIALIIAIILHSVFSDQNWVWFVSSPIFIFGLVAGFYWEHQTPKI